VKKERSGAVNGKGKQVLSPSCGAGLSAARLHPRALSTNLSKPYPKMTKISDSKRQRRPGQKFMVSHML
jgi:hypothetical protein